MSYVAWVIGSSGLLGSALRRSIGARDGWRDAGLPSLPWHDDDALRMAARTSMQQLLTVAEAEGEDWVVLWAGGSVVTSSSRGDVERELGQFKSVLGEIADSAVASPARGAFFYASSAGGVYAGSANPPFTELTVPLPLSHYGQFKLDAEKAMATILAPAGVINVAGRISNLYGPGQRLEKPQGLISHLARAQFNPAPASIYVSLDTLRDYFFVYDCADLILDTMAAAFARRAESSLTTTKNLISGQAVTIGALLGVVRSLAKAHPHVMLGTSPAAALQALDLRLGSVVWPDLDERNLTPLPAGIGATLLDVLRRLQEPA